MAQIITYPKLSTLANNDLLLVSDVSSKFKTTNSLEVDTLAQHIIITNNVITGQGTPSYLPVFGPTGKEIEDSIALQDVASGTLTIAGRNVVTGVGTAYRLPYWGTPGSIPGLLEDSPILYNDGIPLVKIELNPVEYTFGRFSFQTQGGVNGFDFKSNGNNGGSYSAGNFRFEKKLGVGRTIDPQGATLDVGQPGDPDPAAWFRNGVVISNNPGGVSVDNTSMVIGSGNNDVVTGSDNCLAIGNGNQILTNSDNGLAVGQGNIIRNVAANSFAIGQANIIDGTAAGQTVRSQVLGYQNNLTGSFSSFIAGGQNTVTTNQNAFALGFSHILSGNDSMFAFGENNTGPSGVSDNNSFMIGGNLQGADSNMAIGFRNDVSTYPATDYPNGLGNTKFVIGVGSVTNSNAIIITEGGVNRGGGGVAQEPRIIMPSLVAFDYADDIAAAAAGIPIGGIYHKAGTLRIRRT